jgi:transposase-like protein
MAVTPDFKERLEKISQRNLKVKHEKNRVWPLEKKIEVVSQYLVLGNMKLVAAMTGVGHGLIREWKGQPWWKEIESEIRQTQNIEKDTKLSKIVDKSLDAVLDRIENGDFIYDQKTGEVKRKPANLKDLHRVSVDMISKQELLRGNVTERRENTQVSIAEQLKMLAMEFAKWSDKKKPTELVEVEDAVYVDEDHKDDFQGASDLVQDSGDVDGTETSRSSDSD